MVAKEKKKKKRWFIQFIHFSYRHKIFKALHGQNEFFLKKERIAKKEEGSPTAVLHPVSSEQREKNERIVKKDFIFPLVDPASCSWMALVWTWFRLVFLRVSVLLLFFSFTGCFFFPGLSFVPLSVQWVEKASGSLDPLSPLICVSPLTKYLLLNTLLPHSDSLLLSVEEEIFFFFFGVCHLFLFFPELWVNSCPRGKHYTCHKQPINLGMFLKNNGTIFFFK